MKFLKYNFRSVYGTFGSALDSFIKLFRREQRSILPAALGRTPPFNFFRAIKEALPKTWTIETGSWALLAKFNSFVTLVKTCLEWSEAAHLNASKKSFGYVLDVPAAWKLGKASIWPNTVGSSNWYA